MRNMLLVVMLAVSPAVAQEFAADMPAADGILAETRALKIARAAQGARAKALSRAEILAEIETLKTKLNEYKNDPARAGIYAGEISRLYLQLAHAAAPAHGNSGGTVLVSFTDRRADILAEIERLSAEFQKYRKDPTRSGIYAAEMSRLYLELALHADRRI